MKELWVRIGSELFEMSHLECARVQKAHLILYYTNEHKYNKIFFFPGEKGEEEALEALDAISKLYEAHAIALSSEAVEDPNIYETFYKWDYKTELRSEVARVKSDLHDKYKKMYEDKIKRWQKKNKIAG